jgi:hypothetical protein
MSFGIFHERYEARNFRTATEVARKGKINNAASNANVR